MRSGEKADRNAAPLVASRGFGGIIQRSREDAADMTGAAARDSAWKAKVTDNPLAFAFEKKVSVHAGMAGAPLARNKALSRMSEGLGRARGAKTSIYIHIPFCEKKCLYCEFFGKLYSDAAAGRYVQALQQHMRKVSALPAAQGFPVQAVYLGGGTPTALRAEYLRDLLKTVAECFPLSNDCEITVEGRIHGFTPEKIEACLASGVNRFSIGVQSFDTDLRRSIGRISDEQEVRAGLERLAAYGQASIVADLIYGLPGQSLEDWERELDVLRETPLDGVDLYQLNIFPGGQLAKALDSGRAKPVAFLQEQGEYFRRGVERMNQYRFARLSVAHWGLSSRERNIYNQFSKQREACLAFGAGSGGMLDGYFYYHKQQPSSYMEGIHGDDASMLETVSMVVAPPARREVMQVVLGQMERCFLDVDALVEAVDEETAVRCLTLVRNWQKAGLLALYEGVADLTTAGQFWQVNLTQGLLTILCADRPPLAGAA